MIPVQSTESIQDLIQNLHAVLSELRKDVAKLQGSEIDKQSVSKSAAIGIARSIILLGILDHSLLINLSADDHPQYIREDGTRAFSGEQSMGANKLINVVDPTVEQDAATKKYVDDNIVANHNALSGLAADDHTQYIKVDGIRAFSGNQSMGSNTLDASAGKILVKDNELVAPSGESDGYIGVACIDTEGRIYFWVEGIKFYVIGVPEIVTGNPIGLLLALTYQT